MMYTLRTSVLNTIHLTDEQTNKAHRQIDGEPYLFARFLTESHCKILMLSGF